MPIIPIQPTRPSKPKPKAAKRKRAYLKCDGCGCRMPISGASTYVVRRDNGRTADVCSKCMLSES